MTYGDTFKMITRRQEGNDAGVRQSYVEELTTQPTPLALEGGFV